MSEYSLKDDKEFQDKLDRYDLAIRKTFDDLFGLNLTPKYANELKSKKKKEPRK